MFNKQAAPGLFSVIILSILFGLSDCAFGKYSGGDGSAGNPYRIETPNDLNSIGANPADWDANFVMVNDINLAAYTGTQFNIIGIDYDNPFTGVFDGKGHTIANFSYTLFDDMFEASSLFGCVSNGEIKNLNFTDPNITGGGAIGTLASIIESGTVTNCHIQGGSIVGFDFTGGLVGVNFEGTLSKCSVETSVTAFCIEDPNICGNYIGGLVGINLGTIRNCYATGNVWGDEEVGGLVGTSDIQGAPPPFSSISNCYAAGVVDGNNFTGALVGRASENASYTSCFWDSDVNPDVNGIGNANDPNVMGKTTAEMQTESTFTDAGWDFVGETGNGVKDIWRLCNEGAEYPQLNLQFPLGDFVCPEGVDVNDLLVLCEQWLLEELWADVWPDGGDGVVDFSDWASFAGGWKSTNDIDELSDFAYQWLKTGTNYYIADIAPAREGDGIVNMSDFSALAENWLR